jgi:putative two-component system response regulator
MQTELHAPGSDTHPILAVDDDPMLLRMIQGGLARYGFEVELAGSVAEARELLRQRPYSLVLSDYEMPGATGLDLLTHVSEAHPGLPFIMLTGHGETPLAREAITSGALDFCSKPFEIRQLARLIEQNGARVERDRQLTVQLTNEVLSGTLRALVAAVDAKDPHTAHHSERGTHLALRLGEALGLSPERLRVLEFAALLHDVGKIGVPDQILLKPGKLDAGEWAIMKQHPVHSARIVGQVAQLAEVATIVRHHHEWMDGTGYPDGLCGEAIPLFARIITLADAYEAMTSDRAYRPAFTSARAREIIRESLGTQFDPHLGAVFLSLEGL